MCRTEDDKISSGDAWEMDGTVADSQELERQLEERDELVQVLTSQLEQAAEQLDRLQRSGGALAKPAESLSAEFLHHQETISQDVAYLVEQWESSQVAGTLGRLEIQLSELRDLMMQTQKVTAETTLAFQGGQDLRKTGPETWQGLRNPQQISLLESFQEALRREESAETDDSDSSAEIPAVNASAGSESDYELPELPSPPRTVDFETATPEQLKAAVRERDQFIETLMDEFHQVHKQVCLNSPTNWEALQNTPEKLKQKLQKLESQIQDQLRLNEVKMSIERARVSREATQLELAKMQLQKHLKKHGIDPREIPGLEHLSDDQTPIIHEKNRSGQKWLNMLRIKDS